MSPQASFEPGKWYLLVTCELCGAKHILPDPSGGQDMKPANSTAQTVCEWLNTQATASNGIATMPIDWVNSCARTR